MTNFSINFSIPWLLLLLIPAIALTLFPYFKIAKKYRRNRNRITSIVLHTIIMVLCISTLAGLSFAYDVPNTSNEVILLVDVSFSGEETKDIKNNFVKNAIEESGDKFKIGVVTFGFDQVYAVELTNDTDKVYEQYLKAKLPDISATDIAAALKYTKTLFTNPEGAKIVLISDGMETDESAISVIRSVASEGISVDTVFIPCDYEDDVQLIDVQVPNYNITVGDTFKLGLTVQSSYEGHGTITLFEAEEDSDFKVANSVDVDFVEGVQSFEIEHMFELPGMHKFYFEIKDEQDNLLQNNIYHSYIFLEVFDKILVIEKYEDESNKLAELLDVDYNIDIVNVEDFSKMPSTLEELREYDEVILVNIAHGDMPAGFETILHSYVYEVGGGLFTVGGNKQDSVTGTDLEVPNAYDRADMRGTLYQQMLPVQVIDYTPPLGLMIVIDRSGSMASTGDSSSGLTKLDLAKQGAKACLGALTELDYVGVITLEDSYSEEMAMSPATNLDDVINVIDNISSGGGTMFTPALRRAGLALKALDKVEKKHIILVTDGMPGDPFDSYSAIIQQNYESDITISIVSIGNSGEENMRKAAEELGGGYYYGLDEKIDDLPRLMREDLNIPEIKDIVMEEFTPKIAIHNSVTSGVTQEEMPSLFGYYGTKLKNGAEAAIAGEYVPIYAQWKYGNGMVGSFMCDLSGAWSTNFISEGGGIRIIYNIVSGLFPKENIRSHDIDVDLIENNYTNQLNIYTNMQNSDTLEVVITSPPADENSAPTVQTISVGATEGYSRISFVAKQSGLHEITLRKKNSGGEVYSEYTIYKTFSYSAEYDVFLDSEGAQAFLTELSERGNGKVVENVWEIFEEFEKFIHKTYDPRLPFIIIAAILFLMDIAVRKFKFKWPHELIRDYKEKKQASKHE